jgi:membrane protein
MKVDPRLERYGERIRGSALWLLYFSRYFIRQFYDQRGLQVASSLAYTTLLSLVPLITVMFAFAGGLPVFDKVSDTIQSFIFQNFVPAFGNTVESYLSEFSRKAGRLTVTGAFTLVVVALLLMNTIDGAFNYIWRVRTRRNPAYRFLVYWAMLTLGPVLVGTGIVATSYVLSLPVVSDVDSSLGLRARLIATLPFLTTATAFTLLYSLVPNTKVLWRHALIGAATAALLFELAKTGFGIYVRSVSTEAIYGAIAVIPLFLVWLYTSWVIVLLGAYITFCVGTFRLEDELRGRLEERWDFSDAFRLVHALWLEQREGRALSMRDLRRRRLVMPQQNVNEIMEYLNAADWVERTAQGEWVLTRDLDNVTLMDFHRIIPRRLLIDGLERTRDRSLSRLNQVLAGHRSALEDGLAVTMASLMEEGDTPLAPGARAAQPESRN